MSVRTSLVVLMVFSTAAIAQTTVPSDQPMKGMLLEGMGNHHHPVSTTNADAQKYFDQGMNLLFGFNHDEAMRSFSKASEIDPKLAMAHWGIAMTLGPNYNVDVDPFREKAAYDEIQKAIGLSATASQAEQDYINAASKHYSNDPKADLKKLATDYVAAMKDLSAKYPDDLDAATFYAESMMLLNPWRLWTHDFKPGENTEKIVDTLESVLKRNPDHIGANHLYIHAIEGSDHADRALESAGRLPGLAPNSGHLVHMPAHIYQRTGDAEASAGSNAAAAAADEALLKNRNDNGVYPMVYYSHNLHFLAYSQAMQGRFADAKKAADQLGEHVKPHVAHMAMLEGFAVIPTVVLVRFEKWDEVMKLPEPPKEQGASCIVWHMARSLAFCGTGKPDDAQKELDALRAIGKMVPPDALVGMLNTAKSFVQLCDDYCTANIALARGDRKSAIASLRKAAADESGLIYDEPPTWWLHSNELLGKTLLADGNPAEAEKVFRQELTWHARSGRALYGLAQSLEAQGKTYDAGWVREQFKAAWKNADTELHP